ncbi:MAG TPA: LacI family DNA-binding transcriptional regulator [Acholeplasmataceae bacterium]|mgnify:CR=1 FL=1|nr:LacI family DNA-binding transcriptional regulator [Acholeplasmataceae bacterium]
MNKKTNIAEIARLAGVSTATVSYVINDVGKVSEKTKIRIREIMAELDYIPSINARSLSNGQTKLIGVTLPLIAPSDTTGTLLETNPFFSEYLGEIHKVISSYGYDILLSGIQVKGKYKNWIKSRGLDGIILLGSYPPDIYEEVKTLNIPTVLTDVYESYANDFHSVNTDDAEGAYLATKHLINLGHKKIGFVGGSIKESPIHNNRYLGYGKAMLEANLKINNDCIFETLTTFEGGLSLASRLMREKTELTALFVDADIVALGMMKACQDAGRKIPDELSIVGFDDIQAASFTSPGLTTIRQFISKKGEIAANLIMKDILANTRTTESKVVKSRLIVRGSTKPLNE